VPASRGGCCGIGWTVSSGVPVTVQVNDVIAVCVPSSTVTMVCVVPGVVGVPVMSPVTKLMASPAGRPEAVYSRGSLSPSVAKIWSETAVPVTVVCAPGLATTGVEFVLIGVITAVRHSTPKLLTCVPDVPYSA
jgi:hypothetical protein